MSQSGIPIVSHAAQMVHNIGEGVTGIFEGKNVFESLGRIIVAPVAATISLVNDLSFNTLANTPLLDQTFEGAKQLNKDIYSADAATKLAKGLATDAALVSGGLAVGGLAVGGSATALASASTLQTLGGTSVALSGAANRDLTQVVAGAGTVAGAQGIQAPQSVNDALNAAKPITSVLENVGQLANPPRPVAAPAAAPVNLSTNNVNGPAQTYFAGFSTGDMLLLVGGALALFYLASNPNVLKGAF